MQRYADVYQCFLISDSLDAILKLYIMDKQLNNLELPHYVI